MWRGWNLNPLLAFMGSNEKLIPLIKKEKDLIY
jgi:hypothetical protein